jgi:hypothetical protein
MARTLIDGGAEVDLWVASALGDVETVHVLLAASPGQVSKPNGVNSNNPAAKVLPIFIAAHEGHLEVVRHLLDQGADPDGFIIDSANDREKGGYEERGAPLMAAIFKKHYDVAHFLLDRGAIARRTGIFGAANVGTVARCICGKLASRSR